MKLMFKGYQGNFPDKLFCKLSRRRKCKNEQSAITLPGLPVFFQHIACAQVGNKCGLTSALIGQKSDQELPPNLGGGVSAFIPKSGIILPIFYERYKLASSVNLYRFTHFLDFPAGSIFVNCLLGKHPQSPLNATCGVGCAFILNAFTYGLLRNLHRSSISHKRKNENMGRVVPDYLCDVWQSTSRQIVGKSCG